MSTFGGVMAEFPDVRVDFFRPVPGLRPPLACFLTHVHSDHLAGLESLKSPFVFSSPATKELLLRLERYPHRLNFTLGILESRKQTYKHLQKLLKPIPFETPTRIELQPGRYIQVTLFDANHCTGAAMFLFEGDGKAVLYTGDIRSEPWFVNSLTRNPFLIEYTSGLKTLDCIYLDTSNTALTEFPTKADGIKELLQKVSKYPPDTVFHFTAWTLGYEEVWMALSKALKSPIHVDRYKLRLYQSLRGESSKKDDTSVAFLAHEGPVLTGYICGNTPQEGCLTDNQTVRLHSCEKGTHCPTINAETVWIKPIIARTTHGELAEVGIGGGGGDLAQHPELELDSDFVIEQLLGLFADAEDVILNDIKSMLLAGSRSLSRAVSLDDMGLDRQEDDLSLSELGKIISRSLTQKRSANVTKSKQQEQGLPRVITFPYSRHSSYTELCDLIRVFRPKDVYACTVDATSWHEGISIQRLFGKHCSDTVFRHDVEMRMIVAEHSEDVEDRQTRTTASAQSSPNVSPVLKHINRNAALSLNLTSGVTVRRNPQGLLRPFDASGNEVSITSKATPPRNISAASPGSASQSLRRKAILDGLEERDMKRARLQIDSTNSLPHDDSGKHSNETPQNTDMHHSHLVLDLRSPVRTPGSEADSDHSGHEGPAIHSSANSVTLDHEEPEVFDNVNNPFDVIDPESTFFDYDDQVVRCSFCGHELWTSKGSCTGEYMGCCRGRMEAIPYFEVTDPEAGPRPTIAADECSEEMIEGPARRAVVGNYLDDDSSAYDSQDAAERHFNEEYDEQDSFIDDDSQPDSNPSDDSSSSDGETDWKEQYNKLQEVHTSLLNDYGELADDYDDLADRYDDLERNAPRGPLDYDSGSDMAERDESGMLVVDVSVPDPIVTELVLSQAQEQSQESEITPHMLRDRVETFEVASSVDGWHNVTMVSTQDNHTHPEIEL